MKKTIIAIMLSVVAIAVAVSQTQTSVVSQSVDTVTPLPLAQAAPLLQSAVIPYGTISAIRPDGSVVIRGMATIVLPPGSIPTIATVPAGYDPTNFDGGSFVLQQTNGVVNITAHWKTTSSP